MAAQQFCYDRGTRANRLPSWQRIDTQKVTMTPTTLFDPVQQWYSHLALASGKKTSSPFLQRLPKNFDHQQPQTKAELLLESITPDCGKPKQNLGLRIEQMCQMW